MYKHLEYVVAFASGNGLDNSFEESKMAKINLESDVLCVLFLIQPSFPVFEYRALPWASL